MYGNGLFARKNTCRQVVRPHTLGHETNVRESLHIQCIINTIYHTCSFVYIYIYRLSLHLDTFGVIHSHINIINTYAIV